MRTVKSRVAPGEEVGWDEGGLEPLPESARECRDCELWRTCRYSHCLDGSGAAQPTWLFVGEAPGVEEDRRGENFVGKAGQLLRDVLGTVGIPVSRCRFTNANRCWPGQGNPTPTQGQVNACRPRLLDEISRVGPQVVVLLGNNALKSYARRAGITRARGVAWEDGESRPVIATWHPSYVQRMLDQGSDAALTQFADDLGIALGLAEKGVVTHADRADWSVVSDLDQALELMEALASLPTTVAYDIEFQGEAWEPDSRLLTVAFCWAERQAACVPLYHPECPYLGRADLALEGFRKLIEARNLRGYGWEAYSAAADMGWPYARYGLPLPILEFDPYTAHHLLDETMNQPSLQQLTWHYLSELAGYNTAFEQLLASDPKRVDPSRGGTYANAPLELLGLKNCGDADACKRLRGVFEPLLREEGRLWEFYQLVTLPAAYPTMAYGLNGARLDRKVAAQLAHDYPVRMAEILDRIRKTPKFQGFEQWYLKRRVAEWQAEEDRRRQRADYKARKMPDWDAQFNPGSHAQVRALFYDWLKLPVTTRTEKTGLPSTNQEARDAIRDDHPAVALIEEYAHVSKFLGTYVKRLRRMAGPDGLVHFRFDLTGTVTGRLSSDFQQFPRKTTNADIKKLIVSRFGADGGILDADVSAGELRVFAMASGDRALHRIFRKKQDPHRMFAAWSHEIDESEVTSALRAEVKSMISFGVIYGRNAQALAADMGWDEPRAQQFIDAYFAMFPGVRRLIESYRQHLREYGWVENLLGRRRRIPEVYSDSPGVRNHAYRQGVNFPIQSTLHDLMLIAQAGIWAAFQELGLRSVMLGEAHDNVVIDYYRPELGQVARIVRGEIEGLAGRFDWVTVPIVADIAAGPSWGELTEEL